MWRSWTIGLLGAWIVVVPFLFYSGSTQTFLLVFSGTVIFGLSMWKIISERKK